MLGKWQGSNPVLCNPMVGGEGFSQSRYWSPGAVSMHGPLAGCALLCSLKSKITLSCKARNWRNIFSPLFKSSVVPVMSWGGLALCMPLLPRDRCKRSFQVYHGGMKTMCVPDYWQCITPKVMECK